MTDPLGKDPWRVGFFQAVRLLGRSAVRREMVGGFPVDPKNEVVRFKAHPSLEFPASEIQAFSENEATGQPSMTVTFMGLTGPMGVLPHSYTELVMERTRYRDHALGAFLDIFNHRLLSLFYRAWEKYRPWVARERGEDDAMTGALFSLVGLGTPGLLGRLAVPDRALLLYAGLVSQRPHSADAVERILSDVLGAPIRIEPFTGQWLTLEPEDRSRLGVKGSSLGLDTVLGSKVWDCQSRFRVRAGPLDLSRFRAFLPGGPAHRAVKDLTQLLVPPELEFDLQPVLAADQVPPLRLGGAASALGWSSWLTSKRPSADASDLVLSFGDVLR